jgi:hypothetical protein
LAVFSCASGPCPLFALDEVEIAQVNEYAKSLAQDEHRVLDVERVAEQQQAAADRKTPKCQRDDAFASALRSNSLHQKAHGERGVAHTDRGYPFRSDCPLPHKRRLLAPGDPGPLPVSNRVL